MKDYSLNKKDRHKFINVFLIDGDFITIYFADGEKLSIPYDDEINYLLNELMKKQVLHTQTPSYKKKFEKRTKKEELILIINSSLILLIAISFILSGINLFIPVLASLLFNSGIRIKNLIRFSKIKRDIEKNMLGLEIIPDIISLPINDVEQIEQISIETKTIIKSGLNQNALENVPYEDLLHLKERIKNMKIISDNNIERAESRDIVLAKVV